MVKLNAFLIRIKGRVRKLLQFKEQQNYSNFNETTIIKKYINQFKDLNNFCVDIAASDGTTMSNTYDLFKGGWKGVAVEFDAGKFSKLSEAYKNFPDSCLLKTKVTPKNILPMLSTCSCPIDFDFLNLDIDSYDYFVLDVMLEKYRPKLICLEINEKIPPPIKFTVLFNDEHYWKGDHFYGLSIAKAYEICEKYNYNIVELEYNNLFLIPAEINNNKQLTVEEAYDNGYRNRSDRKLKMPYNVDMEELLTLPKDEAIQFISKFFEQYKGKYEIK